MDSWSSALDLAGNVSPWGLLTLCFWWMWRMLTSGKLVLRNTVEEHRKVLLDRIAEVAADRDSWREVAQTKDATLNVLAEGVADLQEVAKTSEAMLRSIKHGNG